MPANMTPPHVPTLLCAAAAVVAVVIIYHCFFGRRNAR